MDDALQALRERLAAMEAVQDVLTADLRERAPSARVDQLAAVQRGHAAEITIHATQIAAMKQQGFTLNPVTVVERLFDKADGAKNVWRTVAATFALVVMVGLVYAGYQGFRPGGWVETYLELSTTTGTATGPSQD